MPSTDRLPPEFAPDRRLAVVEAGGTKVLCAYGSGPGEVWDRCRLDTTTPAEVMPRMVDFFGEAFGRRGGPDAFAVVSFGPVEIRDPEAPEYGSIRKTPKPGWEGAHWLEPLRRAFPGVPAVVDTDVNGAALGELTWGAARGLDTLVYLTVGTGIGGGIVAGGRPLHGLLHPEVGHMRIPREAEDRAAFPGACPFHGDCLEGLASGPAIRRRWGTPAEALGEGHPAWPLVADAMAWACVNLACVVSPQRIIIGGGVFQQSFLFPMVRRLVGERLAGYLDVPAIIEGLDQYLVAPGLGQDAGILGAMALGHRLLDGTL